jgi:aconitate hydratase
MALVESSPAFVRRVYDRMGDNLRTIRQRLGRPLTLSEKILLGHLHDPERAELAPGKAYLELDPDRVAMQDATAQMALLQFMLAGLPEVAVPSTVHCDHLIQARAGAQPDLKTALSDNSEVYDFLRSASAKYGIGFWQPGSGIIHQVVLENYAFPGGLLIGTDSHTPNAGGLGMCAIGVGGADAVDVMAGFPWELLQPELIAVRLTGELKGWTAPKDVILWVCGQLTVAGGTNKIVEYIGPGARSISATGKGTITNMGAELGATTSIFGYDDRMDAYLRATKRAELADLARTHQELLVPDPEVEASPDKFYGQVLELDLSTLEPHVVGPHTPDLARPVSQLRADAAAKGYPDAIAVALIGSCTNSSYEDIGRAADVAAQAAAHQQKMVIPLLVTPGSEQIFATIRRDGLMAKIESVGGTVLANACGPCIGQWKREELKPGERTTIITSFNRNFPGRNDANPETMAFMASPEIVMAYGLAGRLSFNPLTDPLQAPDGTSWKLDPPKPAPDLPPGGFAPAGEGFVAPSRTSDLVAVQINKGSQRLAPLSPFPKPWPERFSEMPLLLKAKGKTTTDQISPAGKWLRFRGHLDAISDNMFSGVTNAFTGERGLTIDLTTGERGKPMAEVARRYQVARLLWVVVGDWNYGEGSSREHAAMSPRHLGAGAIMARSLARIHETNLKKQGVLALTFADPEAYERVQEQDRISLPDLASLAPGKPLAAILHHGDGARESVQLLHTLNKEQIAWFWAGSALNRLRSERERMGARAGA